MTRQIELVPKRGAILGPLHRRDPRVGKTLGGEKRTFGTLVRIVCAGTNASDNSLLSVSECNVTVASGAAAWVVSSGRVAKS